MHNSAFKKVLIESSFAFRRGALYDQVEGFLELKTSKRRSKILMNLGVESAPLNCGLKL